MGGKNGAKSSVAEATPAVATGWQPAINQTIAEKLEELGLLAIYPFGEDERPGEDGGMRTVTLAHVFTIGGGEPELFDLETPMGWTVIREQLKRATPENPWIIGRIRKQNRAYILDAPKPEEYPAIGKKIEACAALLSLLLADWKMSAPEEEAF